MSVRITINPADEIYITLQHRAAEERTSIRALITDAIDTRFRSAKPIPVTGPLVGRKKGKPAPGSPDRENPCDVLFA